MLQAIITDIVLSMIIGFAIGSLWIMKKNKVKGPSSNHMKKYIFRYKDKCYKFDTNIIICPKFSL